MPDGDPAEDGVLAVEPRAASAVTMKNWLPFVFGPAVRHRERAADDLVLSFGSSSNS